MERNSFSLKQKTTLVQQLPDDYEEKKFHHFFIDDCQQYRYPFHLIAKFDMHGIPVTFDMPPNFTINKTGEKT